METTTVYNFAYLIYCSIFYNCL